MHGQPVHIDARDQYKRPCLQQPDNMHSRLICVDTRNYDKRPHMHTM